jgi:hypothetical protein
MECNSPVSMSSSHSFSTRKKIGLVSLALLAVLIASGALTSSGAVSFSYTESPSTTAIFSSAPPTFVGSAGNFLSGPFAVSSVFGVSGALPGSPQVNTPLGDSLSQNDLSPKVATAGALDPPTVNCSNHSGCDTISKNPGGATTNLFGLNAVNNLEAFGYNISPPDLGLCANNEYVVETLNVGILQVYDASNLQPVSPVVSLDDLMGLPSQGTSGWGSGGDIMCTYDYSNGGHWFITEFVSTTPEPQSPFSGCFAGVPDTCREGIAVSVTSNPMGAYNVYFLDPNTVNCDPGSACGPAGASGSQILNDYAKIGSTEDAFMLFYDEFNLGPPPAYCSPGGFGCSGFNGAQEFAFSKTALEEGWSATSVNVAYENMGTASNLYPIPANGIYQPGAADCTIGLCWYQIIPAQTPDPSQYDNNNGGTGFMVGSLDFLGAGDNRVAVFDWTGLSNLNTLSSESDNQGIMFGGELLTTRVTYINEGVACLATIGSQFVPTGYCGLGQQKAGPIPLGDNCVAHGFNSSDVSSCPESGIATNGDGATEASYANGELWTAVSTEIVQASKSTPEIRLGATYWGIDTSGSSFSVASQGYVTVPHEDMEFPSIAATDSGSALMSFTINGPDYYPSSAFTWLTDRSGVIHITALGQSPQDGFTEYQGYNLFGLGTLTTRPRWGDYGQAIFVPSIGPGGSDGFNSRGNGGGVYFATEYIQYPNCASIGFPLHGTACDGTRTAAANWGSSINFVPSPAEGSAPPPGGR